MSDEHDGQAEQQPAEEIAQTAPLLPYEIRLNACQVFFQKTPGGGMEAHFCPAAQTPQGPMPMPPAMVVKFDKDGWAMFQETVANDGKPKLKRQVEIVPGGALDDKGGIRGLVDLSKLRST